MALRKVVLEGDAVLRKKSKAVTEFGNRIHLLLDDMWETMKESDGLGLAAPQVGVLRRVAVIGIERPESADGESAADERSDQIGVRRYGQYELINPVIIETEGEICEDEGCLSLPGVVGRVRRPARVKVKAFDRNGNEIIVEGEGLLAKAISHEVDHLEGILFTDIAESIRETEA
ncbi:MAG: peptide deformylase [Clostridiales Family XIII bacterium]|jgi:peptide deformylase|nr:peptide deformylase [Clostridiales Family XIII bacterium]